MRFSLCSRHRPYYGVLSIIIDETRFIEILYCLTNITSTVKYIKIYDIHMHSSKQDLKFYITSRYIYVLTTK